MGSTRKQLSARAKLHTSVPTILAIGGSTVAFFLLPNSLSESGALGLISGVVAAITAKSKAVVTFNPADMTVHEKRRLLTITSLLIAVASLTLLAVAFFVPSDAWFGAAWIGSSAPSIKALLVFNGSFFFFGVALILACGLWRSVDG